MATDTIGNPVLRRLASTSTRVDRERGRVTRVERLPTRPSEASELSPRLGSDLGSISVTRVLQRDAPSGIDSNVATTRS